MSRKTTTVRRKAKRQPPKKRTIRNAFASAWRFIRRVHWIGLALCGAAFVSLLTVELAVTDVTRKMASDPITAIIFVAVAALAGLGVVFGPMAARAIRSHAQRSFAWKVVWVCLALSAWNLSTSLANGQQNIAAEAVRSSPTFAADVARLATLETLIDSVADEPQYEYAFGNYLAERDRIAQKLEGANPKPILFAYENDGWLFWIKAILFHVLVAGFTTAFAVPMEPKRRRATAKTTRRSKTEPVQDDGKVVAFPSF